MPDRLTCLRKNSNKGLMRACFCCKFLCRGCQGRFTDGFEVPVGERVLKQLAIDGLGSGQVTSPTQSYRILRATGPDPPAGHYPSNCWRGGSSRNDAGTGFPARLTNADGRPIPRWSWRATAGQHPLRTHGQGTSSCSKKSDRCTAAAISYPLAGLHTF